MLKPWNRVINLKTYSANSLPRDCSQLEQSMLLFLKFATVLMTLALGVKLNFSLAGDTPQHYQAGLAVSYILISLSLMSVCVAYYQYHETIFKIYLKDRIGSVIQRKTSYLQQSLVYMLVLMLITINVMMAVLNGDDKNIAHRLMAYISTS